MDVGLILFLVFCFALGYSIFSTHTFFVVASENSLTIESDVYQINDKIYGKQKKKLFKKHKKVLDYISKYLRERDNTRLINSLIALNKDSIKILENATLISSVLNTKVEKSKKNKNLIKKHKEMLESLNKEFEENLEIYSYVLLQIPNIKQNYGFNLDEDIIGTIQNKVNKSNDFFCNSYYEDLMSKYTPKKKKKNKKS